MEAFEPNTVPSGIPRDVFLPFKNGGLSSSFSSSSNNNDPEPSSSYTSTESEENDIHPVTDYEDEQYNNGQGPHDHHDVKSHSSSVWSLSTTSEITNPSHVGEDIQLNAAAHKAAASKTKERSAKPLPPFYPSINPSEREIQLAVEAAYNDLEDKDETIESLPPLIQDSSLLEPASVVAVTKTTTTGTTFVTPAITDDEEDMDNEDNDDDEPLFDPFSLHSEADGDAFSDYYSHFETSMSNLGHEQSLPTAALNLVVGVVSDTTTATASPKSNSRTKTIERTSKNRGSCSPSPRRQLMMKQLRRHSDLGIGTTKTNCDINATVAARRKRRILVPLHARMEMIQHQSQKPFRTVSRAIFGSVQKLQDRMIRPQIMTGIRTGNNRPALLKQPSPATSRSRMNVFRRTSDVQAPFGYQFEDAASAVSSLPDLPNVGSEETGRTLPLEHSQRTTMESNEGEDDIEEDDHEATMVYPIQFLIDQTSKSGKATASLSTTTLDHDNDEDGDLRWLFARQQLPLNTPVHRRGENRNEDWSKCNRTNAPVHTLIHI